MEHPCWEKGQETPRGREELLSAGPAFSSDCSLGWQMFYRPKEGRKEGHWTGDLSCLSHFLKEATHKSDKTNSKSLHLRT